MIVPEQTKAKPCEATILDMFCKWDTDASGFIMEDSLRHVLVSSGVKEADVTAMFGSRRAIEAGWNKDGHIDYKAFINWLHNPSLAFAMEAGMGKQAKNWELTIMTLNLQYFASYPKDGEAAKNRLREATGVDNPPDIICVQEGLASRDALSPIGFRLCVCSAQSGKAQPIREMVYGDAAALKGCEEAVHSQMLCNQIYMRQGCAWELIDSGVMQTSSDFFLDGKGGRAEGKLAIRSMVWVKLRSPGNLGPCVYAMCTHITGGRFEDQFFVQQLAHERFQQPDRIINFFNERPEASVDDVGILIGDFNATTEYTSDGPMGGYFKSSIVSSEGVQADAMQNRVETTLEEQFKSYMLSPFEAIQEKHGWTMAYTQDQVGVTSGFGHLIDHMALSRPLNVTSAEVIYFTNQKFGNKPKDTELPLTDHNAVKVVVAIR